MRRHTNPSAKSPSQVAPFDDDVYEARGRAEESVDPADVQSVEAGLAEVDMGEAEHGEASKAVEISPREIMRQLREAHRETAKEAREAMRESARQARKSEREMARQLRESRVPAMHRNRVREPGEPDTRERIQQIALELFTENGYEATSLREIAERLGVTKAALYYHFKTKDDIIDSLVADRLAYVDELVEWAQCQPRGVATRREAIRRYAEELHRQGHHDLMRFFERNQSSMTQHKAGLMMRTRMMKLLDALADPGAPLPDQIRCSLAIFALHSTWFTIRDPQTTDEQRREAALEVALGLIAGTGQPTPEHSGGAGA